MNKIAAGVLLFFGCAVLVFSIISIATPDWVIGLLSRFGLWEICFGDNCEALTYDLVTWRMWFARVFMISGALSLLSTCFQLVRVLFQNTDISTEGIFGGFMASAIQIMIAMSVFTSGVTIGYGASWGYSFVLGWATFVLCLILAVAAGCSA